MKQYNRRDFIQISAIAIGSINISGLPIAHDWKIGTKHIFKYAFCNEMLKDLSWPEQCEIIGKAGYEGVEISPFTLVKESVQDISPGKRKQMVQDMKNAGIVCAGLHWLFVPPPKGLHFTTPDGPLRQKSIDYLDKLIDFCGDLGGKIMIFGSPNQRGTTKGLSIQEATNNFSDGLAKVADHAKERDVMILVESLPKTSTDVVNTLEEAMKVVNKVGHPAISTMFDFHNTLDETEPLTDLIRKYYEHIHHVHVQNMDGTYIKSDKIPQELIQIFMELKKLNYKKWISVEVFDPSPGGKLIAEESMKTFLEIQRRIG
jgi:D-psicose/D-tagatose/L-ribulose 3-epimerase